VDSQKGLSSMKFVTELDMWAFLSFIIYARFEVLTTMTKKITNFWDDILQSGRHEYLPFQRKLL
jgi:hypothetical protein